MEFLPGIRIHFVLCGIEGWGVRETPFSIGEWFIISNHPTRQNRKQLYGGAIAQWGRKGVRQNGRNCRWKKVETARLKWSIKTVEFRFTTRLALIHSLRCESVSQTPSFSTLNIKD